LSKLGGSFNRIRRYPIPLQSGHTYGLIASKRLGRSLGINLSGTQRKLCDYNCVYCFYGKTSGPPENEEFPAVDDVISAVEDFLTSDIQADWLTFSGNGEPTIHPEFPTIVREVRKLVEKKRPGLRIALLTNGSTVRNENVINSLRWIDLPIIKLDAGDQESLMQINRPVVSEIKAEELIEGLRRISVDGRLTIQSVMFDGRPTNTRGDVYQKWLEAIDYIKPDALQVYTLDFPIGSISPIDNQSLNRIAGDTMKSGIQTTIYIEESN